MCRDKLDFSNYAKDLNKYFGELYQLPTVDSTNEYAKRLAIDGASCALVVAEEQTNGRGRMGRSFYSPKSTGAYFSILLTPARPLGSAVTLTGAAAVAVMRAIRKETGIQTAIKWVNDLYLGKKKVCGILAEAISDFDGKGARVILGIGINLTTEEFPEELIGKAGSLNSRVDPASLIASVCRELIPFLCDLENREWLADYRAHSMVIGHRVLWRRGECEHCGKAIGINDLGELEILSDTGEQEVLRTGEISLFIDPV